METGKIQQLVKGIDGAIKAYESTNTGAARLAVLGQASMLTRTIAEPEDMVGIHIANMIESVTIRVMLSLKIFHALPDQGSISLAELAAKTGTEEPLLARLMRMAVACMLVDQLSDLSFASTKLSRGYAQDPGPALAFQLIYDEVFLPLARFHTYLGEKGAVEPKSQFTSPFAWTAGQEGTSIWDIMTQHPERLATFQRGLPYYDGHLPKTGYYDFNRLGEIASPDQTVFVDVGAGLGQTLLQILAVSPAIQSSKCVMQDMPNVLEIARKEGHLPADLTLMSHDFYTLNPIKGACAYYFRRIFHDYSDAICRDILNGIVPAMGPNSVLLISDYVVPDRVTPQNLEVAAASVIMFTMAGTERSETQFRTLLESVGLEMTGVFKPPFSDYGLIEARLPKK